MPAPNNRHNSILPIGRTEHVFTVTNYELLLVAEVPFN